jgi:peptidoglycan/LPS O-acetylase OafA/YrhL
MLSYGAGRSQAARRYGGGGACDEDDRMPAYLRLLTAAALFAFAAAYVYFGKGDKDTADMMLGMACALAAGSAFFAIRRWRRRRARLE